MKLVNITATIFGCLTMILSCGTECKTDKLITSPPMGWNSFDSYGVYLYHDAAIKNIDAMAERYKEFGYDCFVIDAGWFGEFDVDPETMVPIDANIHSDNLNIDEYGRLMPSKTFFPHGLKVIADHAHSKGLKFGVHIMRGISRAALKANTPIYGTEYFARDIADTTSLCHWCSQNVGIDMSKPGSQEFYNSFVDQLASWGVDYIKADDIVPHPREVDALVKAIEQCDRDIILSLSPGGVVPPDGVESFKRANMLRVTHDIWDEQIGLEQCFAAWRKWQGYEEEDFYIDMDMIPFGELQIMAPLPKGLNGDENKQALMRAKESGDTDVALYSGKGWHRQSNFDENQHYSFITLRALSASPLMIGGDLVSMDDFSYSLLTNRDMIECNQNGVMGHLVNESGKLEVWSVADKKNPSRGWIGVFNRDTKDSRSVIINSELLGVDLCCNSIYDIWGESALSDGQVKEVAPNGAIFIKYGAK